jgi:uncharacterized protein (DUF3820 family)
MDTALLCQRNKQFPHGNLMKWSYVSLTAQIEGLAELVVVFLYGM